MIRCAMTAFLVVCGFLLAVLCLAPATWEDR